jgi:hypothetical protein
VSWQPQSTSDELAMDQVLNAEVDIGFFIPGQTRSLLALRSHGLCRVARCLGLFCSSIAFAALCLMLLAALSLVENIDPNRWQQVVDSDEFLILPTFLIALAWMSNHSTTMHI